MGREVHRSRNSGDSHFEGGAYQRLHTACLLGQTTNSYMTLATVPFLNRVHLENTEACLQPPQTPPLAQTGIQKPSGQSH